MKFLLASCPSCGHSLPLKSLVKAKIECGNCKKKLKPNDKQVLTITLLVPLLAYITLQIDWRLMVATTSLAVIFFMPRIKYEVVE